MTKAEELVVLADRCEREGASYALEVEIACVVGQKSDPPRNYTISVDAALALLPIGWFWRAGRTTSFAGWAHVQKTHADHCDRNDEHSSTKARTPPLALCAAALRARAALAAVGKAPAPQASAERARSANERTPPPRSGT